MPFITLHPWEINHAFVVNKSSWTPVTKGTACRKHCWYWTVISCRDKSSLCGESSFLHTFAKMLPVHKFCKGIFFNVAFGFFCRFWPWTSSYLTDKCQVSCLMQRRNKNKFRMGQETAPSGLYCSLILLLSSLKEVLVLLWATLIMRSPLSRIESFAFKWKTY